MKSKSTYPHLDHIYSDDLAFSSLIMNNLKRSNLEAHLHGIIVDLGCGSGQTLHLLKKEYPSAICIGVDLAPSKWFPVSYVCADMRQTGIKDGTATLVFSVNIGDYLTNEFTANQLWTEVDRLLVPGGVYLSLDISCDELTAPFRAAGYRELRPYLYLKQNDI